VKFVLSCRHGSPQKCIAVRIRVVYGLSRLAAGWRRVPASKRAMLVRSSSRHMEATRATAQRPLAKRIPTANAPFCCIRRTCLFFTPVSCDVEHAAACIRIAQSLSLFLLFFSVKVFPQCESHEMRPRTLSLTKCAALAPQLTFAVVTPGNMWSLLSPHKASHLLLPFKASHNPQAWLTLVLARNLSLLGYGML
jgi:hypothetical protein